MNIQYSANTQNANFIHKLNLGESCTNIKNGIFFFPVRKKCENIHYILHITPTQRMGKHIWELDNWHQSWNKHDIIYTKLLHKGNI